MSIRPLAPYTKKFVIQDNLIGLGWFFRISVRNDADPKKKYQMCASFSDGMKVSH